MKSWFIFPLLICVLIFVHVHFLPHCNRKALVQFSCPTQRKILEATSPALPFYFSLLGWIYWKKMGKGEREREGMREGQREEFSAMLNLDSQLCLHSWLVFQNFSLNALVFLQFHVAMALCTYTLESKMTIITCSIVGINLASINISNYSLLFTILITSSSSHCKNKF